ncbi:MAG: hypothetical protein HQL88_09130 [Magnetococcales bacterium]|nr:hypothetical protein [Magnetococcales bacterium]
MLPPVVSSPAPLLSPEQVKKLEKMQKELTALQSAIENLQGKSPYEVEGRIRQFQEKEAEIKQFIRELGLY